MPTDAHGLDRATDWVREGLHAPGEGRYRRDHTRSAGSRREHRGGEVEVAFLSDVMGVPYPDGSQACYTRGDRARIPDELVPRLKRRGHILTLED